MHLIGRYLETDRNFYRRLLQIAIPVILQSVITTGVNLVDNIMLGQLTETALSGSTQANQFVMLFTYAIMGISMGASVLSSRYWGRRILIPSKKLLPSHYGSVWLWACYLLLPISFLHGRSWDCIFAQRQGRRFRLESLICFGVPPAIC